PKTLVTSMCPPCPEPPKSLKHPPILPLPPPPSSSNLDSIPSLLPVTSPAHYLPAVAEAAPHPPQVPLSPPWTVTLRTPPVFLTPLAPLWTCIHMPPPSMPAKPSVLSQLPPVIPTAHPQPAITHVGLHRVFQSLAPFSHWILDSTSALRPIDSALTPCSLLVIPPAAPGYLVPKAPPWSLVDHPSPHTSGFTSLLLPSGFTFILSHQQLRLGPPDPLCVWVSIAGVITGACFPGSTSQASIMELLLTKATPAWALILAGLWFSSSSLSNSRLFPGSFLLLYPLVPFAPLSVPSPPRLLFALLFCHPLPTPWTPYVRHPFALSCLLFGL
ncbi:hypothetical protein M9458_036838, partial [Cirrhinus mrigala]